MSYLSDPKHWRERAEETRAVAQQAYDDDSRARLMRVAEEYDRIAEQAEYRAGTELRNV